MDFKKVGITKKPSGATFRKLRKLREEEHKRTQQQFEKWLTRNSTSTLSEGTEFSGSQIENNDNATDDEVENTVTQPSGSSVFLGDGESCFTSSTHNASYAVYAPINSDSFAEQSQETYVEVKDVDDKLTISANNRDSNAKQSEQAEQIQMPGNFQFHDPGTWPPITERVKCYLIEHGPEKNKLENYPNTISAAGNRHFSANWFIKNLPNGEKIDRQWLLYGISNNAIYCFPCMLFSVTKNCNLSDPLKGFNNWCHLSPRVPEHENSSEHRTCYMMWKDLEKRLKEGNTIDDEFQKAITMEKEKWRNILKVVFDTIMFCAKNNLALRGSSDTIGTPKSGIFLSTIELISHYHPQLAEHIATVKAAKNSTSYFSPTIQNELILLVGQKVKNEIISRIQEAKYYSILFDCTPDMSRKEQMTEIIRYVLIKDGQCTIEESFIDFFESHEKTGLGLATEILEKIKNDGLNLDNCRGQGYDNGANMAGKYKGVQARITSLNNLAIFVPCAAHSLNLVGVNAAEVSPLMITFFGQVQKIFNFFSGSPGRWQKLMEVLSVSLKGHSKTRWSARKEAVSPLHKQIESVFKVLNDIIHDTSCNVETVAGAKDLVKQIDLSFLCLLDLWCQILTLIDRDNRSLQSKNISVDAASKLVRGLVASIQNLRDKGTENIISTAKDKAKQIGIQADFPDKRKRKVKRMSFEEGEDEAHLMTPEKDFERQSKTVFDSILTQLQWRFETMSCVSSDFEFLSGVSLSVLSVEELKKCAADLAQKYGDLDAVEFMSEIESFKFQANSLLGSLKNSNPIEILQLIHTYSLMDIYPNIEIALRIFLTIPVTVASCERSFSKLKLVKNYLRSTMGQERLTSLSIVSIENDLANSLNYDNIIDDFASSKARKVYIK